MATVDKMTRKGLKQFIQSNNRNGLLGNTKNPLKKYLGVLGLDVDRFEDLTTDRVPVWANDFVYNVRAAGIKNLTFGRAEQFI